MYLQRKDLLDKGYLELLETFGDELTIVNAARVSFGAQKDKLTEADTKLIKYLYEHEHMCYDDKTQIFTNKGWKYFKDISLDTKVAAVNINGFMTYEYPINIYAKEYSGDLYRAVTDYVDMAVTPNHRLYVSKDNIETWKVASPDEIFSKPYKIKQGAIYQGFQHNTNKKQDYCNGYAEGYILSNASHIQENGSFVITYDNNYEYVFKNYLHNKGIVHLIVNQNGGITTIEIYDYNHVLKDTIPEWVFEDSVHYRMGYFHGISEGSYFSTGLNHEIRFSTKGMAELFVRLATTLGISLCYKTKTIVSLEITSPYVNQKRVNDCFIDYSGMVYCCTVSTGLLLVRRNGLSCVSGNSPFRHLMFRFRIKCPEFVARQALKHIVGIETSYGSCLASHKDTAWNELCLAGNMKIMFNDGKARDLEYLYIKYISNIAWFNDKKLLTLEDGKPVYHPISAIYERGIQKVNRLVLKNGNYVDCTMNHKILTDKGWLKLADINLFKNKIQTITGLQDIKRLDYIGLLMCYDIEVASNTHSFAANNIIVHNSGRYKPIQDYYYPEAWRLQSINNKQCSSGEYSKDGDQCHEIYNQCMDKIQECYNFLLDKGIAKEQARIILPLSMYTEFIWTCSAQAALHFIDLRCDETSQYEIRVYAQAMKEMLESRFPNLCKIWFEKENKGENKIIYGLR